MTKQLKKKTMNHFTHFSQFNTYVDSILAMPHFESRNATLMEFLQHQAKLYGANSTPLLVALRRAHAGAVQFLIETNNADVNATRVGRPMLLEAVETDSVAVVQLLLDNGCDPNQRDLYRLDFSTALHIAVMRRNDEMLQLLVRRGARLNHDDMMHTALASIDALRLLFEAGFDPDRAENIPLFPSNPVLAAIPKQIDLVLLLLACGASMRRHFAFFRTCACPRLAALACVAFERSPPEFHPSLELASVNDHIQWARRELNRARLELICERATQVCIALQALDLPALLLVMIVDTACEPFASCVSMHLKWRLVTAVKHSRRAGSID
jgi:hypothetical protein